MHYIIVIYHIVLLYLLILMEAVPVGPVTSRYKKSWNILHYIAIAKEKAIGSIVIGSLFHGRGPPGPVQYILLIDSSANEHEANANK